MNPEKSTNNKSRREKIITSARKLFFEKGYKDTSMEKIARLANYSKRTIYLDFKNKDDLYITICSQGLEILNENLRKVFKENPTYEECIEKTKDVYLAFFHDHREYFRMNFKEANPEILANCSEGVRNRTAELEQICMEVPITYVQMGIDEKVIPPIDPREPATIFVAAITGLLLLTITGNQTLIPEEQVNYLASEAIQVVKEGYKNKADLYYQSR